jgi:hypothetical protein
LLEVLDPTFKSLEPGCGVRRWYLGTRGTQAGDCDHRERRDPHDYSECEQKHNRVHVAFLV